MESFRVVYHLYADDKQLYLSFNIMNADAAIVKIEDCLQYVKEWMTENMLKLNEDKTEFLLMSGERQRATKFYLQISGITIENSKTVRILVQHLTPLST